MLAKKMVEMSKQKSIIREIYEFGMKRAKEVGRENVFDFSIGNPNVPAPEIVKEVAIDILEKQDPVMTHSYPSNAGLVSTKIAIAKSLNERFDMDFTENQIFMSIGAAGAIMVCFRALIDGPEDEIITFAPYFPEYKAFVEGAGGKLSVIPADIDSFQINFEEFEKALNPNVKGVLINSPNNPTGIVYSEDTIKKLAAILEEKQKEYGHSIYIISDEPYREIAFANVFVPYVPKYYDNTLVCYSYSKSLSIPGERIGYVAFSKRAEDADILLPVLVAAARSLAYVSAPSLYQMVVERCVDETADLSIYERNKEIFYNGLIEMGYTCVEPGGAFYLFPRALEEDANAFCERAKKYNLLLVPGDSFGCPGHVRISYCVPTEVIERALPLFKKLADEYK
ncbi:MAG: pyridoxal phosphate-dependent aminotransferase [Lachnospiraceae bacterium]